MSRIYWMKTSAVACALALVACNGDDAAPTVSGVALDGYLSGALACLDVNDNFACDAQEPSAQTRTGGRFTIPLGGMSPSDAALIRVVVEVPPTAIEEDTGEATGAFYTLTGPVGRHAIISPLTTLVAEQMRVSGQTEAEAASVLAAALNGIEPQALFSDVARSDASPDQVFLHAYARSVVQVFKRGYADVVSIFLGAQPEAAERAQVFSLLGREILARADVLADLSAAGTPLDPSDIQAFTNPVLSSHLAARFAPATSLGADLEAGLCRGLSLYNAHCRFLQDGRLGMNSFYLSPPWEAIHGSKTAWVSGAWASYDLFAPAAVISGNTATLTLPGETETWTASALDVSGLDISGIASVIKAGAPAAYELSGTTFPEGTRLYRIDSVNTMEEALKVVPGIDDVLVASIDSLLTAYRDDGEWLAYRREIDLPSDYCHTMCGPTVTRTELARFAADGRLLRMVAVQTDEEEWGIHEYSESALAEGSWWRGPLLGLDVLRLYDENHALIATIAVDGGSLRFVQAVAPGTTSWTLYYFRLPEGLAFESLLDDLF